MINTYRRLSELLNAIPLATDEQGQQNLDKQSQEWRQYQEAKEALINGTSHQLADQHDYDTFTARQLKRVAGLLIDNCLALYRQSIPESDRGNYSATADQHERKPQLITQNRRGKAKPKKRPRR